MNLGGYKHCLEDCLDEKNFLKSEKEKNMKRGEKGYWRDLGDLLEYIGSTGHLKRSQNRNRPAV